MLDRAEPMTDQPIYPAPAKGQVLLIVDDDKAFLQRLARAMEKRGFVTETAESVAEARAEGGGGQPRLRGRRHAARGRQRPRRDRDHPRAAGRRRAPSS